MTSRTTTRKARPRKVAQKKAAPSQDNPIQLDQEEEVTAEAPEKAPETFDPGPPPTSEGAVWVWVTPQMAAEFLAHNKVNRDLRRSSYESYVRQMREGMWGPGAVPIVLDQDGNLINGQHRLTALIETNTSAWFLVLREAPPEVAKVVNDVAAAKLSDVLKHRGERNYIVLAGIANNTYLWSQGLLGRANRISPLEGELWLDKHYPELRHSMDMAIHASNATLAEIGPTALGTAHWIIAKSNGQAEADRFLMRIGYLAGEQVNSPVYALVKRLQKTESNNRRKERRPQMRDLISTLIRTWNYDVEGREVRGIAVFPKGGWKDPVPLVKAEPMTDEEFEDLRAMLAKVDQAKAIRAGKKISDLAEATEESDPAAQAPVDEDEAEPGERRWQSLPDSGEDKVS